ncbi:sporulation initiation phosphotransferase [Halobacillus fulvus]|nr:sporulation initiation phosphotransferase [Halobacillus fulvus]
MDDQELVLLLRHKRHDWMNQIQLIQGYASLNKQDRVLEQLENLKEEAEEERKLLNCGAGSFIVWLETFNWKHDQLRIQYYFKEEIDLSRHDRIVTAYGKRLIEILEDHGAEGELYEGKVHLYKGFDPSAIGLSWEWEGLFHKSDDLKAQLEKEGWIATVFDDRELSIEMTLD